MSADWAGPPGPPTGARLPRARGWRLQISPFPNPTITLHRRAPGTCACATRARSWLRWATGPSWCWPRWPAWRPAARASCSSSGPPTRPASCSSPAPRRCARLAAAGRDVRARGRCRQACSPYRNTAPALTPRHCFLRLMSRAAGMVAAHHDRAGAAHAGATTGGNERRRCDALQGGLPCCGTLPGCGTAI